MKLIKNLQAHLKCMWRIIWLPVPNFRIRIEAFLESIRLFKIYQQIRTPLWIHKELVHLISTGPVKGDAAPSTESVEFVDKSVIEEYLSTLKIASLVHPTAACLERSIRILQILHAKGVNPGDVNLKIGVRRTPSGVQGHAWVEYCGQPILNLPPLPDGRGELGPPISMIPNLLVPEREYDYIWNGDALIKATTQGVQETRRYEVKEGLIVQQLGGEDAVLLDLIDGTCFSLNPISYEIWETLIHNGRLDESIRRISQRSDIDEASVKTDVEELLSHFMNAGLIRERT